MIRRYVLTVFCVLCLAACVADKPSRSACIVKVESRAPTDMRAGDVGVLGLMPAARELDIPLAGYAVANPQVVYLQFGDHCGDRLPMATRLVDAAFPEGGVSISQETIAPGPATIDISGNSWRD